MGEYSRSHFANAKRGMKSTEKQILALPNRGGDWHSLPGAEA